jgi:DNA-binding GntR family transcriptional regulator
MPNAMAKLEDYLLEKGQVSETDDSRLLRQVAYDRLRDAIKHANLQPGDPISEVRISKAMGISRTPVREAIQQLAQEGLVQIIPGRAIMVAAPSIQEVLDAIHVRELLEPEVVRLTAQGISAETREILQTLMQEMERTAKAGDRSGWSVADVKWHEVLCGACPNQLLGQLVVQARDRIHRKSVHELVSDQYLVRGTEEHRHILEAIFAGQGETAQQLMLDHLKQVRENMFKRLVRY